MGLLFLLEGVIDREGFEEAIFCLELLALDFLATAFCLGFCDSPRRSLTEFFSIALPTNAPTAPPTTAPTGPATTAPRTAPAAPPPATFLGTRIFTSFLREFLCPCII